MSDRRLGKRMKYYTAIEQQQTQDARAPQTANRNAQIVGGVRSVDQRRANHADSKNLYPYEIDLAPVLDAPSVTIEMLGFHERFLVWATRYWFQLDAAGARNLFVLADTFRMAKIPETFAAFDAVMTILSKTARRPLRISVPNDTRLLEDEKRLLFLLSTRPGKSRDRVSVELLSCRGTVMLRPLLSQFGGLYAKAGYSFPTRKWSFPETTISMETLD